MLLAVNEHCMRLISGVPGVKKVLSLMRVSVLSCQARLRAAGPSPWWLCCRGLSSCVRQHALWLANTLL